MIKALTAVLALGILASCGGNKSLHQFEATSGGPDEFGVLPSAQLQMPSDLTHLPSPTPGAGNLVDATPKADAIAALGGRASAANAGGVPAADRALIAAASRYGVPAGIRQTVATEDKAIRSGAGIGGLFGGNRYFARYARQKLDAKSELRRLRGLGIRTPSAPPQ